ncbi:MAG TPA: chorismate mutase [Thermoanaerobacterales bacterium]|nr:chorismate mutase [Thermoanaerobacterales bacterium]
MDNLRKQIDEIDTELVKLFERRMEQSLQIAEYKIRENIPILDEEREKAVIEKNTMRLKNRELNEELREFFSTIIRLSKKIQNREFNKNNM